MIFWKITIDKVIKKKVRCIGYLLTRNVEVRQTVLQVNKFKGGRKEWINKFHEKTPGGILTKNAHVFRA